MYICYILQSFAPLAPLPANMQTQWQRNERNQTPLQPIGFSICFSCVSEHFLLLLSVFRSILERPPGATCHFSEIPLKAIAFLKHQDSLSDTRIEYEMPTEKETKTSVHWMERGFLCSAAFGLEFASTFSVSEPGHFTPFSRALNAGHVREKLGGHQGSLDVIQMAAKLNGLFHSGLDVLYVSALTDSRSANIEFFAAVCL